MSQESDTPLDEAGDPGYRWAIGSDPDAVYVQLPVVGAPGGAHDAMRRLFSLRGFSGVAADDPAAGAEVANGCVLAREDDERAVLVVTIGERVGVTRIPVPHGDVAWSARVFGAGQVLVVLTEDAIEDAAVTPERLAGDAAAGGLSAALVPAGDL